MFTDLFQRERNKKDDVRYHVYAFYSTLFLCIKLPFIQSSIAWISYTIYNISNILFVFDGKKKTLFIFISDIMLNK